ncbi:hypothetical protein DFR58_11079 [Anaerobacterium chartisolvens]|uniref:CARDB domain-containing protein n=2 Tax=Anaerobacterium chartisolvens TaxID=1297424 RepID=A0A369B520_9FIRM|nr:hypothetical protein DFR58_11079 [Anaerobacterium chartisolvens]
MIFAILFQITASQVVFADDPLSITSPDITISGIEISGRSSSSNDIGEGDKFRLTFKLNNKNSTETLKNISVAINSSSSFSPVDSGSVKFLSKDLAPGSSDEVIFYLQYDGGSNTKLPLTIKYTRGDGTTVYEQSDFIAISGASSGGSSSPSPSYPSDTTKYAPQLIVAGDSLIPTGWAGGKLSFSLPVRNNSSYAAKNIVISPVIDDISGGLLSLDKMNLSVNAEAMKANEVREFPFSFDISPNAVAKVYPLKFSFQYANAYGNTFTSEQIIYVRIGNALKSPRIVVNSVVTDPSSIQPGNPFKLDITLRNQGNTPAKDVRVSLTGLKNDGISIIGSTDKRYIDGINGGKEAVLTYSLSCSPKLEGGSNGLTAKIEYKDESNTEHTEESQFFINSLGSTERANVEISGITSPEGSVKPSEDFQIAFDLLNSGTTDAVNVKVSVAGDKDIVPKSADTKILPSLKKGESQKLVFTMFASQDAVTKNYPVAVNVEYEIDQAGTKVKQSVSQYVGVYVDNGQGKSVPRIIVDKYSFEPSQIIAGENFTLDMSFMNTSKQTPIGNVKISISSDDGIFSPVDSSNTFFADSISPKGTIKRDVVLRPKSDAESKQYVLSVNYEYEDDKGNPYTSKDIISIPVIQTPRLVTGEISIYPEVFANQPVPISAEFFNMGKSILYNLIIKAEGDFQVQGSSYFVGNFEPGKSDMFDVTVVAASAGEAKGNIIFSFEDASGKPMEIRKDFTMNVMDMPPPPDMEGMNPENMKPEDANGGRLKLILFAAGGLVLLAGIIIATVIIRRKIKARKDLMLDE